MLNVLGAGTVLSGLWLGVSASAIALWFTGAVHVTPRMMTSFLYYHDSSAVQRVHVSSHLSPPHDHRENNLYVYWSTIVCFCEQL